MKAKKKRKPKKLTSWDPIFVLKIYQLAKAGLGNTLIAKSLGITYGTFLNWQKRKKTVRQAIKEGRSEDQEPMTTFRNFCYNRLPNHLKETWDEILECEKDESALGRLEAMLRNHGRRGRQHLFLHAIIHYNFNLSAACRAVNISRKRFDKWAVSDPDFAELIQELKWHQKNFYEGALIRLVKKGDSAAIRMVNTTFNADRGYGRVNTVNKNVSVTGTILNEHTQIPIEELGLSLEERKRILEQLRKKNSNELESPKEKRVIVIPQEDK